MLSESEIKRAKELLFEYKQNNRDISAIENKLNNREIKTEFKEQYQSELTDFRERQTEIEATIQKEFGHLTEKYEIKITPRILRNEVDGKPLEREPTHADPLNPDHPHEQQKQPPVSVWATDPEKLAKDKKEQEGQKKPATDRKPITEQTFTVTHPKGEVPQSAYEDMYRQPTHHDRPHKNRYKGREK